MSDDSQRSSQVVYNYYRYCAWNRDHLKDLKYQGISSDETASVCAAARMGYILVSKVPQSTDIEIHGQLKRFEILGVNPFTPQRRRMSIVCREDRTKPVFLYCKGADTSIIPLLNESSKHVRNMKKAILQLARAGLRTIVLSYRTLSMTEAKQYRKLHEEARGAIHRRSEKMESVAKKFEVNLKILGVVALQEDLSPGADKMLEVMTDTGTGLWIMTGDSPEYSLQVARTLKLLACDSVAFLTADIWRKIRAASKRNRFKDRDSQRDSRERKLTGAVGGVAPVIQEAEQQQARDQKAKSTPENLDVSHGQQRRESRKDIIQLFSHFKKYRKMAQNKTLAIVLTGRLIRLFSMSLEAQTVLLLMTCSSDLVICSRVTPAQKGLLINTLRRCLSPSPTICAVGDGIGDVQMLKSADISILITQNQRFKTEDPYEPESYGFTEVQAFADIQLGNIGQLVRLLACHGTLAGRKVAGAIFTCYFGSIAVTWGQFCSIFVSACSGMVLYTTQWWHFAFTYLAILVPTILVGSWPSQHSADLMSVGPWIILLARCRQHTTVPTFLLVAVQAIVCSTLNFAFIIGFFKAHADNKDWDTFGEYLLITASGSACLQYLLFDSPTRLSITMALCTTATWAVCAVILHLPFPRDQGDIWGPVLVIIGCLGVQLLFSALARAFTVLLEPGFKAAMVYVTYIFEYLRERKSQIKTYRSLLRKAEMYGIQRPDISVDSSEELELFRSQIEFHMKTAGPHPNSGFLNRIKIYFTQAYIGAVAFPEKQQEQFLAITRSPDNARAIFRLVSEAPAVFGRAFQLRDRLLPYTMTVMTGSKGGDSIDGKSDEVYPSIYPAGGDTTEQDSAGGKGSSPAHSHTKKSELVKQQSSGSPPMVPPLPLATIQMTDTSSSRQRATPGPTADPSIRQTSLFLPDGELDDIVSEASYALSPTRYLEFPASSSSSTTSSEESLLGKGRDTYCGLIESEGDSERGLRVASSTRNLWGSSRSSRAHTGDIGEESSLGAITLDRESCSSFGVPRVSLTSRQIVGQADSASVTASPALGENHESNYLSMERGDSTNQPTRKSKRERDKKKKVTQASDIMRRLDLIFRDQQLENEYGVSIMKERPQLSLFFNFAFAVYLITSLASLIVFLIIRTESHRSILVGAAMRVAASAGILCIGVSGLLFRAMDNFIIAFGTILMLSYIIEATDGFAIYPALPMYCCTVFLVTRIRFQSAVLSGAVFLLAMGVATIIATSANWGLTTTALTYLVGSSLLILLAGYRLEYSLRRRFLLNYQVELSRKKRREILNTMLPPFVVDKMLSCKLNADGIPEGLEPEDPGTVTVIFCDVYDFQTLVSQMPATRLVELLDSLFLFFDKCAEQFGITKIETVFETYLSAAGITPGYKKAFQDPQQDAYDAMDMALAMLEVASFNRYEIGTCESTTDNESSFADRQQPTETRRVRVKIGINSGSVIAGVVGAKKPQYALFGDTVNTASRMKATGQPDLIHVSEETFKYIGGDDALIWKSQITNVKGKGDMTTYLLVAVQGSPYPRFGLVADYADEEMMPTKKGRLVPVDHEIVVPVLRSASQEGVEVSDTIPSQPAGDVSQGGTTTAHQRHAAPESSSSSARAGETEGTIRRGTSGETLELASTSPRSITLVEPIPQTAARFSSEPTVGVIPNWCSEWKKPHVTQQNLSAYVLGIRENDTYREAEDSFSISSPSQESSLCSFAGGSSASPLNPQHPTTGGEDTFSSSVNLDGGSREEEESEETTGSIPLMCPPVWMGAPVAKSRARAMSRPIETDTQPSTGRRGVELRFNSVIPYESYVYESSRHSFNISGSKTARNYLAPVHQDSPTQSIMQEYTHRSTGISSCGTLSRTHDNCFQGNLSARRVGVPYDHFAGSVGSNGQMWNGPGSDIHKQRRFHLFSSLTTLLSQRHGSVLNLSSPFHRKGHLYEGETTNDICKNKVHCKPFDDLPTSVMRHRSRRRSACRQNERHRFPESPMASPRDYGFVSAAHVRDASSHSSGHVHQHERDPTKMQSLKSHERSLLVAPYLVTQKLRELSGALMLGKHSRENRQEDLQNLEKMIPFESSQSIESCSSRSGAKEWAILNKHESMPREISLHGAKGDTIEQTDNNMMYASNNIVSFGDSFELRHWCRRTTALSSMPRGDDSCPLRDDCADDERTTEFDDSSTALRDEWCDSTINRESMTMQLHQSAAPSSPRAARRNVGSPDIIAPPTHRRLSSRHVFQASERGPLPPHHAPGELPPGAESDRASVSTVPAPTKIEAIPLLKKEIIHEDFHSIDRPTYLVNLGKFHKQINRLTLEFRNPEEEQKYCAYLKRDEAEVKCIQNSLLIFANTLALATVLVCISSRSDSSFPVESAAQFWGIRFAVIVCSFALWIKFHIRSRKTSRDTEIFLVNVIYTTSTLLFIVSSSWSGNEILWNWNIDTPALVFTATALHFNNGFLFKHLIFVDLIIAVTLFVYLALVCTLDVYSKAMLIIAPSFFIFNLMSSFVRETVDRCTWYVNEEIHFSEDRARELLNDMLPNQVLEEFQQDRLKQSYKHTNMSFLFADIVGFTAYSKSVHPSKVVELLQKLFASFDRDTTRFGLYKLCTIGDAYVAVSEPVTEENTGFSPSVGADQVWTMASAMLGNIEKVRNTLALPNLDMRIGLHFGSCVGGVIGSGRLRYDFWGMDVLTGNMMESNGKPGKINCSERMKDFYEANFADRFTFAFNTEVTVIDYKVNSYFIYETKELERRIDATLLEKMNAASMSPTHMAPRGSEPHRSSLLNLMVSRVNPASHTIAAGASSLQFTIAVPPTIPENGSAEESGNTSLAVGPFSVVEEESQSSAVVSSPPRNHVATTAVSSPPRNNAATTAVSSPPRDHAEPVVLAADDNDMLV